MKTEHIKLTDLWYQGEYLKVGNIIKEENWSSSEVAEFCLYFVKYVGLKEFELLYKFL